MLLGGPVTGGPTLDPGLPGPQAAVPLSPNPENRVPDKHTPAVHQGRVNLLHTLVPVSQLHISCRLRTKCVQKSQGRTGVPSCVCVGDLDPRHRPAG